jgi:hypothetical protein
VVANWDDGKGEERGDHGRERGERVRPDIGVLWSEILLEEELDAVGERLQYPEGTPPIRTPASLHVGDHLALEPNHEQRHYE